MNRAVTTRPFREHEMTLYYTNGIHTFDSGPQWPVQHSGMHGPNNFSPGCVHWLADIHFRGEDAKIRHRIQFEKKTAVVQNQRGRLRRIAPGYPPYGGRRQKRRVGGALLAPN